MAIFYNYIKGCGASATLGTANVSEGQSLKGTSGWKDITDHWVFLKWMDKLYYNKNGNNGVADFRDARNNPQIYFNNTANLSPSDILSTGRIITSAARGQEMWYDLTFKDGPAENDPTFSMNRQTQFVQKSNSFYTETANWTINDTSNSTPDGFATAVHLYGKGISGGPLIELNYPVAINNNLNVGTKWTSTSWMHLSPTGSNIEFGCSKAIIYGQCDLGSNGSVSTLTIPLYSTSNTSAEIVAQRAIKVENSYGYVKAPYFNATSDARAKENIRKADFSALSIVNSLPVYNFNYKNSEKPSIGVIAQEALDFNINGFSLVENENATGEEGDYMSIKESKLIYILWKAIQEQQKEIEELKLQLRGEK